MDALIRDPKNFLKTRLDLNYTYSRRGVPELALGFTKDDLQDPDKAAKCFTWGDALFATAAALVSVECDQSFSNKQQTWDGKAVLR